MASSLLIVGGTGLVGSAIIRESQRNQYSSQYNRHIYAISRSADSQKSLEGVTYVKGDALNASTLESSFETNPNVVHTVGTLIEFKKYGKDGTYDRLNRDAAVVVAETMAKKYDHVKRRCLVYFSAAHFPPSYLLDERYGLTKREAEQILMSDKFKDKIRVVVMRPGLIYSYHRRQIMLPFALGLIVGSAILKPLTSYVPNNALYFTDRPLLDNEIAHAVFEALEDESVEGICEIDRIRQLAKAWELKNSLKQK